MDCSHSFQVFYDISPSSFGRDASTSNFMQDGMRSGRVVLNLLMSPQQRSSACHCCLVIGQKWYTPSQFSDLHPQPSIDRQLQLRLRQPPTQFEFIIDRVMAQVNANFSISMLQFPIFHPLQWSNDPQSSPMKVLSMTWDKFVNARYLKQCLRAQMRRSSSWIPLPLFYLRIP